MEDAAIRHSIGKDTGKMRAETPTGTLGWGDFGSVARVPLEREKEDRDSVVAESKTSSDQLAQAESQVSEAEDEDDDSDYASDATEMADEDAIRHSMKDVPVKADLHQEVGGKPLKEQDQSDLDRELQDVKDDELRELEKELKELEEKAARRKKQRSPDPTPEEHVAESKVEDLVPEEAVLQQSETREVESSEMPAPSSLAAETKNEEAESDDASEEALAKFNVADELEGEAESDEDEAEEESLTTEMRQSLKPHANPPHIVTHNIEERPDNSISASPMDMQGEWTTSPEPSTPVSPLTPTEKHLSRSSMASIPLSETDLDYDHLSAENVDELLATPRASRARHTRKPSSLEILQNTWEPSRQSTLFDFNKTTPPITPGAPGEEYNEDNNEMGARQSVHFATAEAVSIRSNSSAASITSVKPRSSTTASETSSNATPKRLSSSDDDDVNEVDWRQLERNEQQEKTDKEVPEGAEDESTAFLLARLEQENAALTSNPKAATHSSVTRVRSKSRPPSIAQLRKLVTKGDAPMIRYSLAPDMPLPEEPPAMTELEFWAALVQDYPSTATRLPTLTTSKIRAGIPLPLRGIVWCSMSGARDKNLEEAFDRLVGESSTYEGIINKDVGRSFPGVELFRDAGGDGQRMLGRVLKCFSLYDKEIGYCQGLGFLVGPLLMNMGEREAFCVLVRLMDHYSLQPSFLPSLSGLHMRIYQFTALLKQLLPTLSDHLVEMGVEPAYLSQWFLSCFAVTCPLPMLFRIYDVIFAEGANETVMRVALALMRRSEQKLLDSTEFEEVMQHLLGRQLWDSYNMDPDELVDDFTSLDDAITHARLAELEKEFESQSGEAVGEKAGFLPDVQVAARGFLGRLWAPSHASNKSTSTLSPPTAEKEPRGFLRRSPSKQSISTLNDSNDGVSSGSVSLASTALTDVDSDPRESRADTISLRSKAESTRTQSIVPQAHGMRQEDRDLHGQIEDLLMALGEMQRDHAQLVVRLQRECEDRSEDHRAVKQLVNRMQKKDGEPVTVEERRRTLPPPPRNVSHSRHLSQPPPTHSKDNDDLDELVDKVNERLHTNPRLSVSFETKAQLRDKLNITRAQLLNEETRTRDLNARLENADITIAAHQAEGEDLRAEVAELRTRVNEEFKERQKLEHTVRELQAQARAVERKERLARAESMTDVPTISRSNSDDEASRRISVAAMPISQAPAAGGLRELRLGRRESTTSVQSMRTFRAQAQPATPSPPSRSSNETPPTPTLPSAQNLNPPPPTVQAIFHPRGSSLATQAVLATPEHEPAAEEALLLELVNAKTAEAQARQEVDELRRSLAVQRRKQEEALRLALAEAEVAKAEVAAFRSIEIARSEAKLRGEDRARELMRDGAETPSEDVGGVSVLGLEMPRVETPKDEGVSVSKNSSRGGSPATTPAAGGGGWFWNRRTASTNTAKVQTP